MNFCLGCIFFKKLIAGTSERRYLERERKRGPEVSKLDLHGNFDTGFEISFKIPCAGFF